MRYYTILTLSFIVLFIASCGVNLFSPFSVKDYPEANQYQSANLIDQGRYAEVLSNAERFPAQDHVVAALGIMGFDLKIITNLIQSSNTSLDSILLSWLDTKDKGYIVDLAWGIGRLSQEAGGSFPKSVVLSVGGMSLSMLGLLYLSDIAKDYTNGINPDDGLSDSELYILGSWLVNPPANLSNLFREIGKDKVGNSYTIAGVIVGGVTKFMQGYVNMLSIIASSNNLDLSEVSNVLTSLDGNGDGIISDTEVSNLIVSFISNIISNQ